MTLLYIGQLNFQYDFLSPYKINGMQNLDIAIIKSLRELGIKFKVAGLISNLPECVPIESYKQVCEYIKANEISKVFNCYRLSPRYEVFKPDKVEFLHLLQGQFTRSMPMIGQINNITRLKASGHKIGFVSHSHHEQALKIANETNLLKNFKEFYPDFIFKPYILNHEANFVKKDNGRFAVVAINRPEKHIGFIAKKAKEQCVPLTIFTNEIENTFGAVARTGLSHSDLLKELAQHKALVHWNKLEPAGICFLEAASLGLPFLTNSPSAKESLPFATTLTDELVFSLLDKKRSKDIAAESYKLYNSSEFLNRLQRLIK